MLSRAFVSCSECKGAVLYERKVMPTGDVQHGLHVGGDSEVVNEGDGAGSWGNSPLNKVRINVPAINMTINKHTSAAHMLNSVGDRAVGERGNNDFIISADSLDKQRQIAEDKPTNIQSAISSHRTCFAIERAAHA